MLRSRVDHVLARLLDAPNLPALVRELEPELLHRLVRARGLEACGDIVSLATPEQLSQVFDLDLWRAASPGAPEQFDAARFAQWVEVLVDVDLRLAADRIAALDFDFVTLAMTRHLRVVVPYQPASGAPVYQVGGYSVAAIRGDAPDALLRVLGELDANHHDWFVRLMNECARFAMRDLDEADDLYDFLRAGDQVMSDVAFERERRREKQGFMTPALAMAFLATSRTVSLRADAAPARDHATRAYFRTIERRPMPRMSSMDPVVADVAHALPPADQPSRLTRALLAPPAASAPAPLSAIVAHMQFVGAHDEAAYASRMEEIAYLANALAAGCSCNGAPMSASEAYEAAVATCNLGLEYWPNEWRRTGDGTDPDLLVRQDVVAVFQVGWTVLHAQALAVARHLIEALSTLQSNDQPLAEDLADSWPRVVEAVAAGTPWRARDHLDPIALVDATSWAILVRLLDECPMVPTALVPKPGALTVPTEFAFVSERPQISWVKTFGERLHATLCAR
jgi:hypothetical protein